MSVRLLGSVVGSTSGTGVPWKANAAEPVKPNKIAAKANDRPEPVNLQANPHTERRLGHPQRAGELRFERRPTARRAQGHYPDG